MTTSPRTLNRTIALAWGLLTLAFLLGGLTGWAVRGWVGLDTAVVRVELRVTPVPVPVFQRHEETAL